MRRFFRTFVAAMGILSMVAAGPVFPVKAKSSFLDLATNPLAEEYIKKELLADGDADLKVGFANKNARAVSADFIVSLWKDPDFQQIPFFKIRNATIQGDINAEGISIPFNIEFWNCNFLGRINLQRAHLQSFNMYDGIVTGAVRLNRIVAEGDVALYSTIYEQAVVLFAADIGGSLLAKDSQFNGTQIDEGTSAPFELWKVQVGQATEFTNADIKGEAKVDDAVFGIDVKFDHATFEKAATFKNIRVGNLADFQGAIFKSSVSFESSVMERDTKFTDATFDGDANFDYLTVERFFYFDSTRLNQSFSFKYPTVGWPNFANAAFSGPVNFEGMQASNEMDFTKATYNYLNDPFTVTLAKVDGAVKFDGFTAPAGLSLKHNQFGDLTISGVEDSRFAFIDLDSTKVDGDLTVKNVNTYKFSAEGTVVNNVTTFEAMTVEKELNMSNASLGFFTIDEDGFWPRYQNAANNLRGMTYTDIGLVGNELEDNTWDVLLDMVQHSAYSPQSYRSLSQFLTEKGHPEWAAQVELKRKIRERDDILKDHNTGAWLWSWFMYLFSGYGQIPALAIVWSFLVILIGAIMFSKESDLVVLNDGGSRPKYNSFLYSFALFVPFIELDIAEKWDPKPERRMAWTYKYVLKILGWILTPIALLTFGGIIK